MSERKSSPENDPLSQFLSLVGATRVAKEPESRDSTIIQFIQAAFSQKILDRLNDNLRAFILSLKDLAIPDGTDTIRVMAGSDPIDPSFFERMKDKGWVFEQDLNPDGSGIFKYYKSGYPRIGSRVSFPNGELPVRLSDVINIFQTTNNP